MRAAHSILFFFRAVVISSFALASHTSLSTHSMRAGDKVAERHPYSVYRRNEMDKYTDVRQQDPFTTSFGEGLPFRTYDRNFRARKAASAKFG